MSLKHEVQERQRIARLRQQQVKERAPRASQALRGQGTKKQQRPFLIELFDILPARWKGIAIGLLISLIPSYWVSVLTTGDSRVLSLVPLLGLIAVGYIVGVFIQNRDAG